MVEFAKVMFCIMVVALIIILYVVAQMTDGDNVYMGATVLIGIAIITMITVHLRSTNAGNPVETQKRILQEDEINKEIASQLQEDSSPYKRGRTFFPLQTRGNSFAPYGPTIMRKSVS